MSDRPTPETDAQCDFAQYDAHQWYIFAQELERQRDEAREELVKLRVENDHNWQAIGDLEEMIKLGRELRDALDGVIFSASPNRRENPTMFAAWEEARPILAKAKEVLP